MGGTTQVSKDVTAPLFALATNGMRRVAVVIFIVLFVMLIIKFLGRRNRK